MLLNYYKKREYFTYSWQNWCYHNSSFVKYLPNRNYINPKKQNIYRPFKNKNIYFICA